MVIANVVDKYIKNISTVNVKTGQEYHKRLGYFAQFIQTNYQLDMDELIKTMNVPGKGPKVDVYDMLSSYVSYLHTSGRVTPITLKQWVTTAKNFLEYWDVEISPRKLKMRVRIPRVVRQSKEALSKDDIVNIINGCSNIKLKTYVMFLAATGCRATEALSTRLCDYDLVKNKVFIRGEYTKTKTDRYVLLTNELVEQIKSWLKFKYRTRKISLRNPNRIYTRTPVKDNNDLLFSSDFGDNNPTLDGLYITLLTDFDRTLDRLGGKYAEFETIKKRRRKITFHSFRRWVKSVISDLGFSDYSEWYIGHSGSSYYKKSNKEKYELFRKIEPYLTYLSFASLERQGADIQTKVDSLEDENKRLREREDRLNKEVQTMKVKTDKIDDTIKKIETLKKKLGIT